MKKQITILILITNIVMQCKKQNTTDPDRKKPVAQLVSTTARLLDTAAFPGKRYMHFLITLDIITGDSDIYFSQLPIGYHQFVTFLGSDVIYNYTPYRPMILTTLSETVPESDVYKISAHDTTQLSYFGIVIAHGPWTNFYMQTYRFPYSEGKNDGTYESVIEFDLPYTTSIPQ